MQWLGYIGCYFAGLVSAIFFVFGFAHKKKVDDTGTVFRKPKELEPFRNQSREAQIEQARLDTEAWEK